MAAASDHRPLPAEAASDPRPQQARRRLAALWLLFAVGVAGTLALLLGGGNRPGSTPDAQGVAACTPPARVTLGPRRGKKGQEAAGPPRCCSTEYGQAEEPTVAAAAVFGMGTPGYWGGAMLNQPTDEEVEAQLLRAAAAAAATNSSSSSPEEEGAAAAALDGAAYLVVTSRRDEVGYLEGLLARFDAHFGQQHPAYPLVVFLAGAAPLAGEDEARLRAATPHTQLDLRPVPDLQRLAAAAAEAAAGGKQGNDSGGGASSTSARGAAWAYARALWEFRVTAPRVLAGEREWVLHLSEETLLDEDVVLDPFLALKVRLGSNVNKWKKSRCCCLMIDDTSSSPSPHPHNTNKQQASGRKLGYTTAHRAVHGEGLWAFGRAFAQLHQTPRDAAFQLTRDVPKALDGRWIASHRSVFGADAYQALIVSLASSNLTQPQPQQPSPGSRDPGQRRLARGRGGPTTAAALRRGFGLRTGDELFARAAAEEVGTPPAAAAAAADEVVALAVEALPQETTVLTLGALLGLRPDEFLQYQGVNLQRPPRRRKPGPTSVEGAPAPGPDGAGAATVSQWRGVKITGRAAEDLQPLFDVRREGWLGADVATSFRLPPRPQQPPGPGEGQPEPEAEAGRYLWLFGDTLVGRATPDKRRRGAFFIHNSVALLPAFNASGPPPAPDDVAFAWNVSQGGCPASIFVRRHQDDECLHEEEYLWPISGMGVSYGGQAKVVVLAVRWAYVTALGAGVDLFSDDAFNFKILGTTVLVVDNPHEAPQRWQYRQKVGGRVECVVWLWLGWGDEEQGRGGVELGSSRGSTDQSRRTTPTDQPPPPTPRTSPAPTRT